VRIQISIRHGHLAADSQEKIKAKLEKLARFHDRVSAIDATVDIADELKPAVEITVAADGAPPFVAHADGTSLMGSVETAVHRLEEQLRRHKEKTIDSHRENYRRNRNSEGEHPDEGQEESR
jgi:putative sigma-54 modulation protein